MVIKPRPIPQPYKREEEQTPPFKWESITLREVTETGYRLEGNVYGSVGRQARKDVEECKWGKVYFGDEFIRKAFYLGRFKRIYVDQSKGIPFILPAQITETYPKAVKFISPQTNINIESTRAKRAQILLTRSGTVGVVSYVTKTLKGKSLSDDVIRIEAKDYPGYVYAFLKSKIGRALIETNNYGAVVEHIEPEHLDNLLIPNPPPILKKEIHNLIEASFKLRDKSNDLIDEAHALLKGALRLPSIEKLKSKTKLFYKRSTFLNCSVPLSKLDGRLDGSYHVPIVQTIQAHLEKIAKEVTCIEDSRITERVILPGRFKRVYVQEENGVVFFGGKQLYELDPGNKKYLSLTHHAKRIGEELTLHENMVLVSCSGTIGKVAIVPKHWEGWTANQHIIRMVPAQKNIAGYLYAWLSSDYAYPLITRFSHGAVVDEIDDDHVSKIKVPLLQDANMQKRINDKILKSSQKRAEAYELEQKALKILEEKVIYAR